MLHDLKQAKILLENSADTCVLCKDEIVYRSDRRGVAPLMEIWQSQRSVAGFSAADKVVGKATALLYCLLQVKAVYAHVMSEPALQVLTRHGVITQYKTLVPAIINRTGDGFCPMETATAKITDPKDAPDAILQALNALK